MINRHQEFRTSQGTRYVKSPVAVLCAETSPRIPRAFNYLESVYPDFNAARIDYATNGQGTPSELSQFAGQLCYLAFGDRRTSFADHHEYLAKIKSEGHGSVLEHVSYTFLLAGIDRATTHELVRHRAGMAYSQVSQRFVGPDRLRFVMPLEDQEDEELAKRFEIDIDTNARQYRERIEHLLRKHPAKEGESARDHRKRVQSSARSVLGNYVEAMIVVSFNARAGRHLFEKRLAKTADVRIRRVMLSILHQLQALDPGIFGDFAIDAETGTATPEFTSV